MGFMHESSYYETERQEELYQSSIGHHIRLGHMGHGHQMGHHHINHNHHGLGSGFSADSEYFSYSSISPSHNYGLGHHHSQYAGGMMAAGYAESSMEGCFYATNNGCSPCNRFY